MRKLSIFIILFFCLLTVRAQQVSLQDVANRTYRAEGIRGIKPMLDGEHYTQMSADGKKIIQYSFKTGKETGTIFDVNTARDCSIKSFDDYIMSPDEKLILIQTETKPIYRRSFTANYYIFNVKNNKMEPLSENGPQQVPLFSPDGNQIAFVRDNNIYLVKLLFGNSESQVTKDGKFNEVLMVFPTGYMKRNSASTVLSTSVQTASCLPISVLMRVKYLCILFHYTKVWFPH